METKENNIADHVRFAIDAEELKFRLMLEAIHSQATMPTDKQISDLERQSSYINGMIKALSWIQKAGEDA